MLYIFYTLLDSKMIFIRVLIILIVGQTMKVKGLESTIIIHDWIQYKTICRM